MSKRSFFCPHCFHILKAHELVFRDPKCERVVTRKPSFLEKMGIIDSPKFVPCPQKAYEENARVRPDQCKKCSRRITQRLCPRCSAPLPASIDELSDITIAIVGAKGAGKSHYVALLIQRITQLFRTFDWSLQALTERTVKNYKELFYEPLFRHQNTLESTRNNVDPEPLMYSLKFRKANRRIMLVFFDAAGEHFDSEEKMSTVNRYIYNASGIICLMDPLQLTPVRQELQGRGIPLPDQASDTAEILDRMNRLIRSGYDQKGKSLGESTIPVPLAVAFSKIDALRTDDPEYSGRLLFDSESMVYQDSHYDGYVDSAEMNTIDAHMTSWLEVADPMRGILNQCRDYKKAKFFGFSALGAPPTVDNAKLSCPPRPIRVEDPFLWILAENGLLKLK